MHQKYAFPENMFYMPQHRTKMYLVLLDKSRLRPTRLHTRVLFIILFDARLHRQKRFSQNSEGRMRLIFV